ncbi:hypothetical protein QBC39DRAFT_299879 [Podospora conica]|nr:hypothetical protein QBC39DRAFT_299879 [Schizothecium conicum]
MALWIHGALKAKLGKQPDNAVETSVVAFVGVDDIRYPVVMLALMKLGRTPMLCSPRNSADNLLALLDETACRILLHTSDVKGLEDRPDITQIRVLDVPAVFPDRRDANIPEDACIPERRPINATTTVLILHTSGTTSSRPRPVRISAGAFHAIRMIPLIPRLLIPTPPGRQSNLNKLYNTGLLVSTLPLYHMFGGLQLLCRTLYARRPIVLLDPNYSDSVLLVPFLFLAMSISKATCLAASPSILKEISRIPAFLRVLPRLECVFYGGAPLDEECGNAIAAKTRLYNCLGSTEAGGLPSLIPVDGEDWPYFEWISESGVMMVPVECSTPGLAEMVIARHPSRTAAHNYQFVFHNLNSDVSEWRTNDLFSPHPNKPNLWKHVGRKDDMVKLINGVIVNPVAIEKLVERCPTVISALVFGTGRFHLGLLIERTQPTTAEDDRALFGKLSSFLEPGHAQVPHFMISLAKPEKPFRRTAKGTVVRRLTEMDYEEEIAELYDNETPEYCPAEIELILTPIVREVVRTIFCLAGIALDDDIFRLPGADSMRIIYLARQISASTKIRTSPQLLYSYPTVQRLSRHLSKRPRKKSAHYEAARTNWCSAVDAISREQSMSAMIHEYTESAVRALKEDKRLPFPPPRASPPGPESSYKVVLVGSTGSLGTYILDALLRHSRVESIWCLNWSPESRKSQIASFQQRHFNTHQLLVSDSRVVFLTVDLALDMLGLDEVGYGALAHNLGSLGVVIHCCWPVNFSMPLPFFTNAIQGVANVAKLVAQTGSTMVFISSLASCMNYAEIRRDPSSSGGNNTVVVPEEFDPDHSMPAKLGYGESEHVAECLLSNLARRCSIKTVILRVGQLAGSTEEGHVWHRRGKLHHYLPRMGMIPMSLPPRCDLLQWIPVNKAGEIIASIVNTLATGPPAEKTDPLVLHIANPHPVPWSTIAKAVQALNDGDRIRGVKYQEWLQELKYRVFSHQDPYHPPTIPAYFLLEFFEDMCALERTKDAQATPVFSTLKAQKVCNMLSNVVPRVDDRELLAQWMREWKSEMQAILDNRTLA